MDPLIRVRTAIQALLRNATIQGRESALKVFYEFLEDENIDFAKELKEAADNDGLQTEVVLKCILTFSLWLKTTSVQSKKKKKNVT